MEEIKLATDNKTNKSRTTSTKKGGASTTKNKSNSKQNTKTSNKPLANGTNAREEIIKENKNLSEKEIKLRNEIKLLIALAVTLLLILSNFGLLSTVGGYLSYFMFGLFGFVAYIFPIVLFFGVAFLISNINNPRGIRKFIAGSVLYILTAATIQLVFMDYDKNISVFEYYGICGKGKKGGGLFGAIIEKTLHSLFGMLGTYIILVLLIIIAVVLLTEKSFISGVKKGSTVVYETAKEDATRIRKTAKELARERAYQKKEKRVDNRVHGVAITRVGDNTISEEEDVHEINQDVLRKMSEENSEIYQGHVDFPDGMDYNDNTEDGLFVPKEHIEVSKEAKKVMNRKAFSVGGASTVGGASVVGEASTVGGTNTVEETASSVTVTPVGDEPGNSASQTSKAVQDKPVQRVRAKDYILPSTSLLNKGAAVSGNTNNMKLKEVANKLQEILHTFGVNAAVVDFSRGPSVTRYEIQPETGTRLSKITSLADDIKLNLAATDIRIEPIPGKSTIGIEVPNEGRDSVLIRELIESRELMGNNSKIAFAAGKDIAGKVVVADIGKMPHMLVAGTTGSGKSVFTNSIIMSILFRAKPTEVRLIIVDPKVVEFGIYNGIPHLLQPVVTDPKLASNTLKWAVSEMSDRYKKFADFNVRDLKGYNEKIEAAGKDLGLTKLPQIVIVIDELADLMMVAAKEVEESICRLAQLARAAGIHLIIATQRPSVDVVTGLIKANIPSRCALMVSSGVDSRTIIDSNGAEKLLGNGDMLFYPSGYVKPVRLQGAFVSDQEVQRVVEFWKNQAGDVTYDESIANYIAAPQSVGVTSDDGNEKDDYFFEAARFVIEKEKASTSMLQRMFKIGFNRAARIMDQLCDAGVVGEEEGTKPRKVLMTLEELEQLKD